MTPSPSFVKVGNLADLLFDARVLIEDLSGEGRRSDEVNRWLGQSSQLVAQLKGNRDALQNFIAAALSSVAEAGGFTLDETHPTLDALMHAIDDYGDSLPLVRSAATLELSRDDPAEALAQAIYEISTEISGNPDDWEQAPTELKRVLRETATLLIAAKIAVLPDVFVTASADIANAREQLLERFAASEPTPQVNVEENCPCDLGRPQDCSPEKYPWAHPTGSKLPPNIPMPPGLRPASLDREIDFDFGPDSPGFEATGGGDDPH